MIFKNNKSEVIGEFREGVYRKIVDSEKHKMKVYDGYGIDEDIIDQLKAGEEECKEVRLKEKDTGSVYSVDFATFFDKGIRKTFEGQTAQVFLPLKYWTKIK